MRSLLACLMVCCTPLAGAQAPVGDFSAAPVGGFPAGWKLRGTNGGASKLTVQETEDGGRFALLEYNFADPEHPGGWVGAAGRKTCIMGCWLPIPADHWLLEVDVGGDGSGHGLVLSVGEPNAEWFDYDLGRLDFTGRRSLTLDLRTNWRDNAGPAANGVLDAPLFLASLNVEQQPEGPLAGELRLHGISALPGDPEGLAALSISWFLPDGAAFTRDEEIAPGLRIENLGAARIDGKLSWVVSLDGQTVREGAVPMGLEPQATDLERLSVGDLPVAMYDCEARLEAAGASRALRTTFAVLPQPRPDPDLSFGAGLSNPGFTASPAFPEFVARLARVGASWTLATVGFEAFDGPEQSTEVEAQRAAFDEAQTRGVAIVAALGNLSTDLVDRRGNTGNRLLASDEALRLRHEAASEQAATSLRSAVAGWLTLHLDPDFFRRDSATPGEPVSYGAFVERLRQAVARGDPDARFIAGLFDASFRLAAERGGAGWPEGVGVFSQHHFQTEPRKGAARAALTDLLEWKAAARISGDLWAECWPRWFDATGGSTGQYAEGLARVLVEARYASPRAHLLYRVHASDGVKDGGLLDRQGNIGLTGLAFAICADLLRGAEPSGDFSAAGCRGYLFTCEQGTLAALWPEPAGGPATIGLDAEGAVEHYGACRQYTDVAAGTPGLALKPGINLLRGRFRLAQP